MITIVTAGSKDFVATITNEDYLAMVGGEEMPESYHHWRKQAEKGHANPLFQTHDEEYWFAAFGKAGMDHSTHYYAGGGRIVKHDADDPPSIGQELLIGTPRWWSGEE